MQTPKTLNLLERIAASFTCLLIAVYFFYANYQISNIPLSWINHTAWQSLLFAALFLLFLPGIYYNDFAGFKTNSAKQNHHAIWLSLLAFFCLCLCFRIDIVGILLIVLCSRLPTVMPLRTSAILVAALPLITGAYTVMWSNGDLTNGLLSATLYSMFNLFVLFVTTRVIAERLAKDRAANLLRELKATQTLLSETAKKDERVRIARDLHDTLGHHLAALSIQLEIASHSQQPDKTKQQIEKSQTIAKLLLADIRETVSEFRAKQPINIKKALCELVSGIDGVQINLNLPEAWQLDDAKLAEAVLRICQEALTNSIKHANTEQIDIRLSLSTQALSLMIQDQQTPNSTDFKAGNGINGMCERVDSLNGQCQIGFNQQGFYYRIQLPTASEVMS